MDGGIKTVLNVGMGLIGGLGVSASLPVSAAPLPVSPDSLMAIEPVAIEPVAIELDIDPALLENSPVLQRWSTEIPNVLHDIRHDPSFRTRIRLGYAQLTSIDQASGIILGVEDVFLGQTGFTLSANYQTAFDEPHTNLGSDLHYYVLPLGSVINLAPVIGYRHLESDRYTTDGVNVGVRLLLSLSRTGAADLSLTQSWVSPGVDQEVGITTLSFGYALTPNLRISTDLQQQNAPQQKDRQIGVVLEWMP